MTTAATGATVTRYAASASSAQQEQELQLPSFLLPLHSQSYSQQYSNLYYLRLTQLRPALHLRSHALWSSLPSKPQFVNKVLDISARQGLCFIIGTVYMEMKLKPNIVADLAREHYIAAPPPAQYYYSDSDEVMLEDESGRVRLIGDRILKGAGVFVTGTIMAVLGAETAEGDFEVAELCFAGMAPQVDRLIRNSTPSAATKDDSKKSDAMEIDQALPSAAALPLTSTSQSASTAAEDKEVEEDVEGEWVAIVSGLEMGSTELEAAGNELRCQLLLEWLSGELGDDQDQRQSRKVTKLILAGNSLAQPASSSSTTSNGIGESENGDKKTKRYGYDPTLYSAHPTSLLDTFLTSLLTSLDVDLLPGSNDPTGTILPQQGLHRALLPRGGLMGCREAEVKGKGKWKEKDGKEGKAEGGRKALRMLTNPCWSTVGGTSFFGHSGQPLDDIMKYLSTDDRLDVLAMTLDWRHSAPTGPDTLWCYPLSTNDPFIFSTTPHIYYAGNQPSFGTKVVYDSLDSAADDDGDAHGDRNGAGGTKQEKRKECRIILVPRFCESGEVVLVRAKDGFVKVVRF